MIEILKGRFASKGDDMLAITAEPGFAEVFVIIFVLFAAAIGALLTVIPFWKICQKAGFPPPLSLLMLVPIANVVLPFYIAFAQWPALSNGQQYES
jgi:hypothetical protein